MPGPPPKHSAIRRNRRTGTVLLPAAGRPGRCPKWPLPENPKLTAAVLVARETIEGLRQKDEAGDLNGRERSQLTRARHALAVAEETLRIVTTSEREMWRKLWRTPQAVEWERLKWTARSPSTSGGRRSARSASARPPPRRD